MPKHKEAEPGDRVRLVNCNDEYTHLKPGDMGTVRYIDTVTDVVHVVWDSGSSLGLAWQDGDRYEVVNGA